MRLVLTNVRKNTGLVSPFPFAPSPAKFPQFFSLLAVRDTA